MVIVAGWIKLDAEDRDAFLEDAKAVARMARQAPGCRDFHLSADPLEVDLVNVFERWDDAVAVATFRGSGPPENPAQAILDARVVEYEVVAGEQL